MPLGHSGTNSNSIQFYVKKTHWKCVPNVSDYCSGHSVSIYIPTSVHIWYSGWTLVKTLENISVLCHMHVGLLKYLNQRQLPWNLNSPVTLMLVHQVVRATIQGTWKSACIKRFHFMKSSWMIIGRDNFSAARTLKINWIINQSWIWGY